MTKSVLFWIVMFAWLACGLWPHLEGTGTHWGAIGGIAFAWVATALLGWQVFGKPIKE